MYHSAGTLKLWRLGKTVYHSSGTQAVEAGEDCVPFSWYTEAVEAGKTVYHSSGTQAVEAGEDCVPFSWYTEAVEAGKTVLQIQRKRRP